MKDKKSVTELLIWACIVGTFAGETEQPDILKLYSNTKVLFSEYNPEPFFSNTNNTNKLYKDILGIYYEQCC